MTPLLATIGSHKAGQQTGEIRLVASAADGGRPFGHRFGGPPMGHMDAALPPDA